MEAIHKAAQIIEMTLLVGVVIILPTVLLIALAYEVSTKKKVL